MPTSPSLAYLLSFNTIPGRSAVWIRAGPGPGTTATPAWGSAAPSERARWNAHVRQVACPAGLGSGSSGREESGVDSRPLGGSTRLGGMTCGIPLSRNSTRQRSAEGSRLASTMPWWWSQTNTRLLSDVSPPPTRAPSGALDTRRMVCRSRQRRSRRPSVERRPDRWGDQPPGVSHVEHLRGPALTWIKVVSYRTFGKSVEA